ncbi:hypothetical protein FPQ18DRAFT_393601 [Pyronema domesticum]|nr:hypothetical protein FPQ18DRAFT_393601 [Pyronema domesticum]
MLPRTPTPAPESPAINIELVDVELGLPTPQASPRVAAISGLAPPDITRMPTPMPPAHMMPPNPTPRPFCPPSSPNGSATTLTAGPPPYEATARPASPFNLNWVEHFGGWRMRDIRGRNVILPYANTTANRNSDEIDDLKRWKMLFVGAVAALMVFVVFVVCIYLGPGQGGVNGPVGGQPAQPSRTPRL